MVETFFGFKKTPFCDSPDPKQLFSSQAWDQVKARLQFLADHHGVGLLTGEVGAGKSTAVRCFTAALNPNLYKVLYLHWNSGSTLDLRSEEHTSELQSLCVISYAVFCLKKK